MKSYFHQGIWIKERHLLWVCQVKKHTFQQTPSAKFLLQAWNKESNQWSLMEITGLSTTIFCLLPPKSNDSPKFEITTYLLSRQQAPTK